MGIVIAIILFSLIIIFHELGHFTLAKINKIRVDEFSLGLGPTLIGKKIGGTFFCLKLLPFGGACMMGEDDADDMSEGSFNSKSVWARMFCHCYIAGPIVRYTDIAPQLKQRVHTVEDAALGARRFILGLAKKVLLANVLYELISAYKAGTETSVLFVWLYATGFVLHLYFDFSGYSDMAIGLGRIFGFRFPENFNYPYISASLTEFWRRWHISLGSWFRDYVYIPLGGNRVSRRKQLRNILVVWLLTGLWHGAAWTFVLWGLLFAVLLTMEKLWYGRALTKTHVIKHAYVLLVIAVSFVLFDADSVLGAISTIAALFGLGGLPLTDPLSIYYLWSYAGVFLIAILGATPLPAIIVRQLARGRITGRVVSALEPVVLLALLAICTGYLVDGSFNPFLYFRF